MRKVNERRTGEAGEEVGCRDFTHFEANTTNITLSVGRGFAPQFLIALV